MFGLLMKKLKKTTKELKKRFENTDAVLQSVKRRQDESAKKKRG